MASCCGCSSSPASGAALKPRHRRRSVRAEQPLQGPLRPRAAATRRGCCLVALHPRHNRRCSREPLPRLFPRALGSRARDGPSCFPRPPAFRPSPAVEEEVVAAALRPAYVVVAPVEQRGGGTRAGVFVTRGLCTKEMPVRVTRRFHADTERCPSGSICLPRHRHAHRLLLVGPVGRYCYVRVG